VYIANEIKFQEMVGVTENHWEWVKFCGSSRYFLSGVELQVLEYSPYGGIQTQSNLGSNHA